MTSDLMTPDMSDMSAMSEMSGLSEVPDVTTGLTNCVEYMLNVGLRVAEYNWPRPDLTVLNVTNASRPKQRHLAIARVVNGYIVPVSSLFTLSLLHLFLTSFITLS